MKKSVYRNIGIICILILFCVGVWNYSRPIHEAADIVISTDRSETNGPVLRLYWDEGEGLNIDQTVSSEFIHLKAQLALPSEAIDKAVGYRFDPINVDEDIAITGITINGRTLDLETFAAWVSNYDQVSFGIVLDENSGLKKLQFDVQGEDSQLYMSDAFADYLRHSIRMRTRVKLLLTGIAFLLAIAGIFYKEVYHIGKQVTGQINAFLLSDQKNNKRILLMLAFGTLAVVIFVVMHQYIFGQKFFVFSDKAGDSYYQTYPQLLYYARCIRDNIYQGYNFTTGIGMGANGAPTISIGNWVCYFGPENVAYLMGISQVLKMFLAGVFFYGFMRLKGTSQWYSIILAMGFAFCGHMTMRASWENYPNEVLLFAIWLYTFELLFQKKDVRWILLSTTFFIYNFGGEYYIILYTVLMTAYAIFRYITERKVNFLPILIVMGVLAIGLCVYLKTSGRLVLNSILTSLQSDRFQNGFSSIEWSLHAFLPDFSNFWTVFARTVGLYTLGLITLADPVYYCGIFVLILLPIAFYLQDRKNKICYAIVLVIATIYTFSTQLRFIANGCADNGYKLNSFWISIFLLLLVSKIDWEILRKDAKKKKAALILCVVTGMILLIAINQMSNTLEVSEKDVRISTIFVIIECVAICLLLLVRNLKGICQALLVLCVAVEVGMIAYPIYNNRVTEDGSAYLEDGTIAVIEELQERDDGFYRIDKKYSILFSDSIAQGYNGTACYVGGTGIGDGIRRFYQDLGLAQNPLRIYGTSSYNELEELLGVKYALTTQNNVQNYGFVKEFTSNGIDVYRNENAVTYGFVYRNVIERSRFEQLSYKERQQVLLEAALVEDGSSNLPKISEERLREIHEQNFDLFEQYRISEEELLENPLKENEMLAVKLEFANQNQGISRLYYGTEDGESGSQLIMLQDFAIGQVFEITNTGVNQVWVEGWADLYKIELSKLPKDVYFANYERQIAGLQKNAVQAVSYNSADNHLIGRFVAEEDGILYLPIPSGSGFQIYIDGEYQEQFTINDCFIGINVTKGTHELEYIYPDHGTMWDRYQYWLKRFELVIAAMVIITVAMYCKKKIKGRG